VLEELIKLLRALMDRAEHTRTLAHVCTDTQTYALTQPEERRVPKYTRPDEPSPMVCKSEI